MNADCSYNTPTVIEPGLKGKEIYNMNKLFTKIAALAVGAAMVIGVGIAVGQKSDFKMAKATTASVTISSYASSHSWSSGSKYSSVTIDSHVTATASATTYAGTYNTNSPAGWRFYESDSSVLTISVDPGYELSSITLTYTKANNGSAVYNESNLGSGTAQSVSGTSAQFTVTHTSGTKMGQIGISSISVTYSENSVTKPLTANPTLSTGNSASVAVGRSVSLTITTTPADSDEAINATSANTDKVTVTGSSPNFTINGIAVTDSPVRVTVAGVKGTYSSYVDVTVTDAVQTVEDKILTKDSIGTGGSYPSDVQTTTIDAVDYKWNKIMTGKGVLQFQASNGYVYNYTAYSVGGNAKYIKGITLICHADNSNTFAVYKGSSANPSTEISNASYSASGINYYSFGDDNYQYFKVAAGSKNAGYCTIVVELKDSSSTPLTKARIAAGHILSALNGKCGSGGTGNVTSDEWATLESTLSTDLGDNADAKAILKDATRIRIDNLSFAGATIESAMFRYDYCIDKFGFEPIATITSMTAPTFIDIGFEANSNNSTTLIIVLVSILSVASIGGYFLVRRRKEN